MVNFGPEGDLEIGSDLDLNMASGIDHTAMKIRQRLRTFQGEWWLNPSLGIPYYKNILGQVSPDLEVIRGIFINSISAVPGVASVTSLSLSFDNSTRTIAVTFSAIHDSGEPISETIPL